MSKSLELSPSYIYPLVAESKDFNTYEFLRIVLESGFTEIGINLLKVLGSPDLDFLVTHRNNDQIENNADIQVFEEYARQQLRLTYGETTTLNKVRNLYNNSHPSRP